MEKNLCLKGSGINKNFRYGYSLMAGVAKQNKTKKQTKSSVTSLRGQEE